MASSETEGTEKEEATIDFQSWYNAYLSFEDCWYQEEEQSFPEFLTEWQDRLQPVHEMGEVYSDLALAFKLLKNAGVDHTVQSAVFESIESEMDISAGTILLQTMVALNGIMLGSIDYTDDPSIKQEHTVTANPGLEPEITMADFMEQDLDPWTEGVLLPVERTEKKSAKKVNRKDKTIKTNTNYQCDLCDSTFKQSQSMRAHKRTVHGLEPTCEICKATFTNQSEWIHHMKTEHPEEYSAKLQDLEKDSTCDICLKEFANAMLLKKHKNGVHFKSHQCVKCPKRFAKPKDLEKHLRVHEKREERMDENSSEASVQCWECGKQASNMKRLRDHMRTHWKYRCSNCFTRFKTEEELDKHFAGHKEFPCDKCDRVFTKNYHLQQHLLTVKHNTNKDYGCDICGNMFNTPSNLQRHKKLHDEPSFECTYEGCNKIFANISRMKKHRVIHQDEKEYICPKCGKPFAYKHRLKEHLERHEGIKRHHCDQCEKSFYDKDHLKRHIRTHTGEKPYACDICGKTYAQSNDLKKHMLSHSLQIQLNKLDQVIINV